VDVYRSIVVFGHGTPWTRTTPIHRLPHGFTPLHHRHPPATTTTPSPPPRHTARPHHCYACAHTVVPLFAACRAFCYIPAGPLVYRRRIFTATMRLPTTTTTTLGTVAFTTALKAHHLFSSCRLLLPALLHALPRAALRHANMDARFRARAWTAFAPALHYARFALWTTAFCLLLQAATHPFLLRTALRSRSCQFLLRVHNAHRGFARTFAACAAPPRFHQLLSTCFTCHTCACHHYCYCTRALTAAATLRTVPPPLPHHHHTTFTTRCHADLATPPPPPRLPRARTAPTTATLPCRCHPTCLLPCLPLPHPNPRTHLRRLPACRYTTRRLAGWTGTRTARPTHCWNRHHHRPSTAISLPCCRDGHSHLLRRLLLRAAVLVLRCLAVGHAVGPLPHGLPPRFYVGWPPACPPTGVFIWLGLHYPFHGYGIGWRLFGLRDGPRTGRHHTHLPRIAGDYRTPTPTYFQTPRDYTTPWRR